MNDHLRIAFVDFWPDFNPKQNAIARLLPDHEISDDPEVVFFSCFGTSHQKFKKPLKIQYVGENRRPALWSGDYSLSFDFESYGGRNRRWPLYNLYHDPKFPVHSVDREKFACMVVSNPNSAARLNFFHALSAYRKVDSGGNVLNNVGGRVPNKLDFIRQYKFCIAFENSCYPGYTTEKLLEAKLAGCVPIYWGNPRVAADFDTHSFVNVHDFRAAPDVVDYIAYLDENPQALKAVQETPLLNGNRYTPYSSTEEAKRWLKRVIEDGERHLRSPTMALAQKFMDRRKRVRIDQRAQQLLFGQVDHRKRTKVSADTKSHEVGGDVRTKSRHSIT